MMCVTQRKVLLTDPTTEDAAGVSAVRGPGGDPGDRDDNTSDCNLCSTRSLLQQSGTSSVHNTNADSLRSTRDRNPHTVLHKSRTPALPGLLLPLAHLLLLRSA